MIQYFTKPYGNFSGNVKVGLNLSYYATKANLKGATGVDTSNLAVKSGLAKLKTEVDKIDVDKLKSTLDDLRKLSNVVNNDVVKKTVYDKLLAKVDAIDTNGFVLKSKNNTDKLEIRPRKEN